jgi:hypothetical protein
MTNEEIITALKNSVNNGDSLQSAIQIMINSGYDPREVHEASQFVGGATPNLQANPQEKGMLQQQRSNMVSQQPLKNQQNPPAMQQRSPQQMQRPSQQPLRQQPMQSPSQTLGQPIIKPVGQPPKKSFIKEIILVFILLLLIGVLTLTIIYKDEILGWFG